MQVACRLGNLAIVYYKAAAEWLCIQVPIHPSIHPSVHAYSSIEWWLVSSSVPQMSEVDENNDAFVAHTLYALYALYA